MPTPNLVIDTQAEDTTFHQFETQGTTVPDDDDDFGVAELPELIQLKCLSPVLEARPHLNGNNPSIPRI